MQQFIHFEISLQLVYWFAGGCVRKDYTNASVVLRNILMHSLLVREDLMMFISHVPIKFKCPIVGTNSQKGFSLALFNNTRILSFSVSFFFFSRTSHILWPHIFHVTKSGTWAAWSVCCPFALSAELRTLEHCSMIRSLLSYVSLPGQVPAGQVRARADRPDFAVFRQHLELIR